MSVSLPDLGDAFLAPIMATLSPHPPLPLHLSSPLALLHLPSQKSFRPNLVRCCHNPIETTNGAPARNGLLPSPPRPRRIILVRHGQSQGNVDESVYTRVADPRVPLTERGIAEARECGQKMRNMFENDGADDWKVYFYVSPYTRTLQTLKALGTAFPRSRIAGLREEPRLREQDFGNFQDEEQMRVQKHLRKRYGRFFYRFPNGESAADVYDRITGFRETLKADIDIGRFQPPGQRSPNMNLVIVSHGLTLRVFLMRWYKWTVEQFEGLKNLENGTMLVMERGSGGRYSLLVHHKEEDLRKFGLTDDMLMDQEWQKVAKPGEVNYCCPTLSSFFSHLDQEESCLIGNS